MPIMTEDTDGNTVIVDPRFINITYSQLASNGNEIELTGLVVESGASVGEYLLVEYGNDAILAAHPDWSWRGSYAWADGSSGSFTNTTYTVYNENGENPQTVRGVAFTVTSKEIKDGDNKSITLTNSYSRQEVTLTATKKWTGPSGSAIAWPTGKKVIFQLSTQNQTIDCTNTNQVTVPTGVSFAIAPFAAALPILALCTFLLLRKKRGCYD